MWEQLVEFALDRSRTDIEAWLTNFPVTVGMAYTVADEVNHELRAEFDVLRANPGHFPGPAADALRAGVRWGVARGRQIALRRLVCRNPVRGLLYHPAVPAADRLILWGCYHDRLSLRELGRVLLPPEARCEVPAAAVRARVRMAYENLLAVMPNRPGAGPDQFAFPPPEQLL